MGEAQWIARFLLLVVACVLVVGSVLVSLGNARENWLAASILLWVAAALLLVNLFLGEVTVKRGRT